MASVLSQSLSPWIVQCIFMVSRLLKVLAGRKGGSRSVLDSEKKAIGIYELQRRRTRLDVRKDTQMEKRVKYWNRLPWACGTSITNGFQRELGKCLPGIM